MAAVEFIDLAGEIQEDARGMSFFPWRSRGRKPPDLLQTFHLISIRPGHVRGNHLHPGHEEWLYPFHGPGILIWEEEPGTVREKEVAGGRWMIRISPGVAHAVRNPGPDSLYLLAWREATGVGPAEPETVPQPLASGS